MFLPIPMMIPMESVSLEERVRRLEQALVLSLESLQSIAEILDRQFGPEILGEDLKHFTTACSDAELQEIIQSIESSLNAGKTPIAVRQIRDAYGCTWDQAHHVLREWGNHTREKKLRWLRLARYIKSIEKPPGDCSRMSLS